MASGMMTEKTKILIVDDDLRYIDILEEILGDDHQIGHATDGAQALERLASFEPCIILLDVAMPGMDGLDVCSRIRADERYKFVKIILVSGYNSLEHRLQGYEAGADDFISKPFDKDEIRMKIRVFERLKNVEESDQALRKEKKHLEELIEELGDINKQLMQSEKMAAIGQLAAGIAHEINNPVGYVCSNLGMLKKYISSILQLLDAYERLENAGPEAMANELQNITALKQTMDIDYIKDDLCALLDESRNGVIRVKQIVQDLKDFTHVDKADWQWADLHRGLDSTLNVVNNEIKYKAEVIKEYGTLPEIECIPSQLNQVFMNLLVNAAHAIEGHGTIMIRSGVDERQGWVWVEIADSGKGIGAENLSRIFDPFYTSKPVGQGTGLGLSLSYNIIEKHGGRIKVDSELDKGTNFTIWLPVEQAERRVG